MSAHIILARVFDAVLSFFRCFVWNMLAVLTSELWCGDLGFIYVLINWHQCVGFMFCGFFGIFLGCSCAISCLDWTCL